MSTVCFLPVHPWKKKKKSVPAEKVIEWCQLSKVRISQSWEWKGWELLQWRFCSRRATLPACSPVIFKCSSWELHLRLHPSPNLKWLHNHFARKGILSFSLTTWKRAEKSDWQRNADGNASKMPTLQLASKPAIKGIFFFSPLVFFSFYNGRGWEQVWHLPETLCGVAACLRLGSDPAWDTVGRVWCWSWTVSAVTHFQLCSIPTSSSSSCLAVGTGHPSCSSPAPKAEQGHSRQDFSQEESLRRVLPSELPAVSVPQKLLVT